jgi:hypothetical protein
MLMKSSERVGLKKKLHERQETPPLVSERKTWRASDGENVGSEIKGKSALFSRLVIIYKKRLIALPGGDTGHGRFAILPRRRA